MEDIKKTIAKKLVELRRKKKLTQVELAEILHYSDKAISKWEHGESLPSIEVFYELSVLYDVPIDYMTHEGDYLPPKKTISQKEKRNRPIIVLLAISAVWFLSTFVYIYSYMAFNKFYWVIFIWAVVPTSIISLIFNCIWGKRIYTFYIVSVLMWSLLCGFYCQFLSLNLWWCFILGAPLQVSIILWAGLR